MNGKRYYWLKLKEDFFTSKRIKKLRKLAGGDTYTIIYLKMQLLSLKTDGILRWSGLEDNFADELALDIDESPENVRVVLQYLLSCGLAETDDNTTFFLPWVAENTGSENASAQRVREYRSKQKALQCNADVTEVKRLGNVEKEIEKEIELEKDSKRKRFTAPTVEEVRAYCQERGNSVDPAHFIAHYEANGWKVGRNQMKDWKAAVRTWEKNEFDKPKKSPKYMSTGQQKPLSAEEWEDVLNRI